MRKIFLFVFLLGCNPYLPELECGKQCGANGYKYTTEQNGWGTPTRICECLGNN